VSLPSPNDLEPLISESRLAKIEQRLRKEFPQLPENAAFLAYLQPAQEIEYQGAPVQIGEIAMFSIFVPHPKHPERPGFGYMPVGRMIYKSRQSGEKGWRELEQDHRHSTDIESDPAYLAFKLGPIKLAVDWYESVKDLIVKKPSAGSHLVTEGP
jgi:hypothetical protein